MKWSSKLLSSSERNQAVAQITHQMRRTSNPVQLKLDRYFACFVPGKVGICTQSSTHGQQDHQPWPVKESPTLPPQKSAIPEILHCGKPVSPENLLGPPPGVRGAQVLTSTLVPSSVQVAIWSFEKEDGGVINAIVPRLPLVGNLRHLKDCLLQRNISGLCTHSSP